MLQIHGNSAKWIINTLNKEDNQQQPIHNLKQGDRFIQFSSIKVPPNTTCNKYYNQLNNSISEIKTFEQLNNDFQKFQNQFKNLIVEYNYKGQTITPSQYLTNFNNPISTYVLHLASALKKVNDNIINTEKYQKDYLKISISSFADTGFLSDKLNININTNYDKIIK